MSILITGGAGFIGSNLAKRLEQEKKRSHTPKAYYTITTLDDYSADTRSNLQDFKGEKLELDVSNPDALNNIKDVDLIYHLACQKMVKSIAHPVRDLDVNARGTLNILEYARKHDVPVIYTSTGSVYGNPSKYPTPETYPSNPESPYGVSKRAGEQYCRLYHKLYGLRVIVARIHSVYGPGQSIIGVIPKFIHQSLEGKPHTVEGLGLQARSFTYIDDCLTGLMLLSRRGEAGEIYNLAGDRPVNILCISRMISKELKTSWQFVNTYRKEGDLDLSFPDITKILNLGWKPETPLREGIKKTVKSILEAYP
jgi:nucleoside-diphosphate-sugar epimerase